MKTATADCRHRLSDALGTEYFRLPPGVGRGARGTLVIVHGQNRDVDSLVAAFLPYAIRLGLDLIAPEFTATRHRGYQRLLTSDPSRNAVDVLDEVLSDAGVGVNERVLLFGFSGGAQFAHRYAIARPDRILALSIAAAGWYTFPTPNQPFPYGVAPGSLPVGDDDLLSGLLTFPVQVLVGERDTNRDASLRSSRRVDRHQGPNRVSRALAWVEAMRRLAPDAGPPDLQILPGVGHRFDRCVRAGMIESAIAWFSRQLDRSKAPSPRRGSGEQCDMSSPSIAAIGVE